MHAPRRLGRLLLASLLAALFVDQAIQHLVLGDGLLRGQRVAPFDPPLFTRAQMEQLVSLRSRLAQDPAELVRSAQLDPELGWCPRAGERRGLFLYDGWGARTGATPLPAREEIPTLVAALGCSFTRGDEVAAEEAWVSRVDEGLPELRIANFGVGGHGLDQALLRYRRDVRPRRPDEVWLGLLPSAVLRNTSRFPLIAEHWGSLLAFKPRFTLDADGALVLLPNPAPEPEDLLRLLSDQTALLAALGDTEPWIRRLPAAFAPMGSSWTHRFASTRLLLTRLEGRGHRPWERLPDPEDEAARLVVALVVQAAREARADGARFLLLVLPGGTDLDAVERRGRPYWEGVVERIRAAGVEVLDTTEPLLEARARGDRDLWAPGGHYSSAGNEVVAEAVLASRGGR